MFLVWKNLTKMFGLFDEYLHCHRSSEGDGTSSLFFQRYCTLTRIVTDRWRAMLKQISDTIDDALVFCQTCRHGGHASHIMEWFHSDDGRRKTCPVADCDCYCDE